MKDNILALKRKMLVKYPFFGSIIANVEYIEDKNILTAGTDGEKIYYNPEYLNSLSVDEQVFVFSHEVCHIAFNHILRSEGKDSKLWNIATDGVINQFLKLDGLKSPNRIVDIKEAINYDAEQLYEKLLQLKQKNKNSQNKNNNKNNNNQSQEQNISSNNKLNDQNAQLQKKNDVGHDTHGMWNQAIKKYKEKQKESLSNHLGKNDNKEKSELEKKQEKLENMGEKKSFQKNREEKKKQLKELKESINKEASIFTNSNIRTINDIGSSKPIIDWRYILKNTIKYDVDWSYRNATIENGVVTAKLEEIPMPETEIVLDTSSSINKTLLKNFLRECKNLLKYTKLKVGCFDTKFYGFHEIRTENDIENMEFIGGGGTDFNVAVDAFSRRVENKIIFTDGNASMPNKLVDLIWIVYGDVKINPKIGKVIYITEEQLKKMSTYKLENESKGRTK